MDKNRIKVTLGILFSFLLAINLFAQTWRSTDISTFSPFTFTYAGTSTLGTRYFSINPYDNSIWLSYLNAAQRIDNFGSYSFYDNTNTPVLPANAKVNDYAFTPDFAFLLDGNTGLYKWDGSSWSLANAFTNGIDLCYDADTVWSIRTNQNYMKWFGGFNTMGTASFCRKAISKNGSFWGGDGNSVFQLVQDAPILYSPDTCSLMGWGNFDMKFCPGTDSLFVSCNGGLAIADGVVFNDSICSANTTNMPTGTILEFEFDQDNNIWALFGTSTWTVQKLAFLNMNTKDWSMVYDGTNSPIRFNYPQVSIEMDTVGNLWVVDRELLHVLDFGSAPQWLSVFEATNDNQIQVFPNPSNDVINILANEKYNKIKIVDAIGQPVFDAAFHSNFSLDVKNLAKGMYILQLFSDQKAIYKSFIVD